MKSPSNSVERSTVERFDERLQMLEEVDFKWLMAGQGWWIDAQRLHDDRSYASQWLERARQIDLQPLQQCAQLLQKSSQMACH